MKHSLALVLAMVFTATASAQLVEYPQLMPFGAKGQGEKELDELLARCVKGGGLRYGEGPQKKGGRYELVDPVKLKASVVSNRGLLTPALCERLLALWFDGLARAGKGDVLEAIKGLGGAIRKKVADPEEAELRPEPPPAALLHAVGEVANDDRALAFAAFFTGREHEQRSDYAAAVDEYRRAGRLFGNGKDTAWQATCLNNSGTVLSDQGEYVYSLKDLRLALTVSPNTPERQPFRATVLDNLGYVYQCRGEYRQALANFEAAQKNREARRIENNPAVAISFMNIGAVHLEQAERPGSGGDDTVSGRERAQALRSFRQALDIWEKILAKEQLSIVKVIEHGIHNGPGEDSDRLLQRQRALNVLRKEYGEHSPALMNSLATLGNIGFVYQGQGKYAEALEQFDRALAVRRKIYGERHPAVAASFLNRAGVYLGQRKHEQAVGDLEKALTALLLTPGKASASPERLAPGDVLPLPLTVEVLLRYGEAREASLGGERDLSRLRACAQTYQLAIGVLNRVRQEALRSEASKVFHGARRYELFPRHVGLRLRLYEREGKAEDLQAAFTAAEHGTARVFLESLVLGGPRARLLGGVKRELGLQEDELLKQLHELDGRLDGELSKPLATRSGDRVREFLAKRDRLEEQLQRLIERMKREHPRYAALRYPQPCTLPEARACLGPNEVALLYVLGTGSSYVVLVEGRPAPGDKAGGLAVYRLPGARELGEWVSTLTDPDTLSRSALARARGEEAYAQLLGPLTARIRGKDLVIVPTEDLYHLPFELLVESDGDNSHYLVEAHRIRYAPSLTVLHQVRLWDRARTRPPRALWAVGDPVYGASDERLPERAEGGLGGDPYPRLKFSGVEVGKLAELLGAPREDVCTGLDAREAAVHEASRSGRLSRARYVHFAVHGVPGRGERRQPSLVLSLVGNQGGHDGFLDAAEVLTLKLNADLVVLSACRSGRGRLSSGEGVEGLARAFLYAGSRAVLCSLWSVADGETATLMVEVYRGLKADKPAPDALRAAQLAMIRTGKPPLYWAPFILIGD
jgi:CHAT domain-containing protein/Tfp pilus assembly protein PilF